MTDIEHVDDDSLAKATQIVRAGGVIVLPTDTVYGVACDPSNAQAIERIYEIKHRSHTKSLQILLSSTDQLDALGLVLPSPLDVLSQALLPGAFSPITVAQNSSNLATLRTEDDGSRTQAIRVPDSRVSLSIIAATGPLAATSANRSGDESAQTVQEAYTQLGDAVDLYLDGGPTVSHVASTVMAADTHDPDGIRVIREGVIPQAELRSRLQSIRVSASSPSVSTNHHADGAGGSDRAHGVPDPRGVDGTKPAAGAVNAQDRTDA